MTTTPTKVALVNPPWSFDGSIYFGCREPHLPLEFGYAKALLEEAGHDVLLIDAQLFGLNDEDIHTALRKFAPEITVLTTAPSYLFWRCAPPELRVPISTANRIRSVAGTLVVVGPHASTTPRAVLKKLGAEFAIMGECEDVLVALASSTSIDALESVVWLDPHQPEKPLCGNPRRNATDLTKLPALRWSPAALNKHNHHHHRFDQNPEQIQARRRGMGAEIEASRGCPYHCTFCAKDKFRNEFRKRPLTILLAELDALINEGVPYVYFIDEIFLPDRKLLEALRDRHRQAGLQFGVQLRIDNWSPEMLDLLGEAGCVSIEAGMESVTEKGRSLLAKHCKLTTEQLTDRLIHAKRSVAFVQANLLDSTSDRPEDVCAWRERLLRGGVWANEPVPLFPYPGSPEFTLRIGTMTDDAWERAHAHYLQSFATFSDVQEGLKDGQRPRPLPELEMHQHA